MEKPNQANREREIFIAALELESSQERLGYLKGACGGNAELFERVSALLQAHEQATAFLAQPPAEVAQGCVTAPPLTEPTHFGPGGIVAAPPVSEKPGDKIAHYKLLQQIGEGGCGVVYMAEQEEPVRRRVALKVIKLGMDTKQVIARFEAERQALALMDHPNIAKVLDAGATDTGRPFFVMELVRGIKITEFCDQKKLSTRERLDLFMQVCAAIQHAHQKGIIHRDLKPSNLLVTINDGVAVPKVIDFGIAKATNQQRLTDKTLFTSFEQFIGTPAYMSPEQAEMTSLDIDTRSDIYSLGVVLYELLTGRTSFDADKLLQSGVEGIRRTLREDEPPKPSTRISTLAELDLTTVAKVRQVEPARLSSSLRGDLDWVVMKCLEKDRARRYDTANGLVMDLKRYLHNEPVLARPPSTAYLLQKLMRRHKLVFAAGSAVVASLVIGLGTAMWMFLQEKAAHSRALAAEKEQSRLRQKADEAFATESKLREEAVERERIGRQNLYAADMNLAYQSWDVDNFGRTLELLDKQVPQNGEEDLRGFEWRYLKGLCRSDELFPLGRHALPIWAIAVSPDGKTLATGGRDKAVKLWDLPKRRFVRPLEGHTDAITSVAFSPDGKTLATGSWDQSVKLWDVLSGKVDQSITNSTGKIFAVAFSPDGKTLAIGSQSSEIRLWDYRANRELNSLRLHSRTVWSVAFSPPDGELLAAGGEDGTITLWQMPGGRLLRSVDGHQGWIFSIAFSREGRRLATASDQNLVKLWDLPALSYVDQHDSGGIVPFGLDFSSVGNTLAIGMGDGTIKLWDLTTKAIRKLKGHTQGLSFGSVHFSPDGKTLISGGVDTTIKLWDPNAPPKDPFVRGHTQAVGRVVFSPDGKTFASASFDGTARLWSMATQMELAQLSGQSNWIVGVDFSSDGKTVATLSKDRIELWEIASGEQTPNLQPRLIAKGTEPGEGLNGGIAFSPNAPILATGIGKIVKLWDAATLQPIVVLGRLDREMYMNCVKFSPDGRLLATGGYDNTVKFWDVEKQKEMRTLAVDQDFVSAVSFSRDGTLLATGGGDGTIKLWDVRRLEQAVVMAILRGHGNLVEDVSFSPNGHSLASASDDGTIMLWNLAVGKAVATLTGHHGMVNSVAFSPDGNLLISCANDATIRLWRAPTFAEIEAREKKK